VIIKNKDIEINISDIDMHHLEIKSKDDLLQFIDQISPSIRKVGFDEN
jgi:hypothetical protein